jgi:hypothetical protein
MAQWMAPYSCGGRANDAAAPATVGMVTSRHGWAAQSGSDKQTSRVNCKMRIRNLELGIRVAPFGKFMPELCIELFPVSTRTLNVNCANYEWRNPGRVQSVLSGES